jgi:hypothetical protein
MMTGLFWASATTAATGAARWPLSANHGTVQLPVVST